MSQAPRGPRAAPLSCGKRGEGKLTQVAVQGVSRQGTILSTFTENVPFPVSMPLIEQKPTTEAQPLGTAKESVLSLLEQNLSSSLIPWILCANVTKMLLA